VLDQAIDADRMAAIAGRARTRPGVLDVAGRTRCASQVEVDGQPRVAPLLAFVAAPDDPMRW